MGYLLFRYLDYGVVPVLCMSYIWRIGFKPGILVSRKDPQRLHLQSYIACLWFTSTLFRNLMVHRNHWPSFDFSHNTLTVLNQQWRSRKLVLGVQIYIFTEKNLFILRLCINSLKIQLYLVLSGLCLGGANTPLGYATM